MPHIPPADVAIHQVRSRDKPRKCCDRRGLYREIAPHCTKAWRFKYRFADQEKRNSLGIDPEGALERKSISWDCGRSRVLWGLMGVARERHGEAGGVRGAFRGIAGDPGCCGD